MKIVTVVGARPQFIKAAVGSRELRKFHREIIVHTGQHFASNMSDVFFEELGIPAPEYNLGISGGSHAQMTAKMLTSIEEVLLHEKPDMVLVYGDTNSTLSAALAAVKLKIPVAHVESGNRFGTLDSPEEINRILTDHMSSVRFACTQSALDSLHNEGLAAHSHLVGDPMLDAFLYFREKAMQKSIELIGLDGTPVDIPTDFYYMTCHRQENTENPETLMEILTAMDSLDAETIYPVHPRNEQTVRSLMKQNLLKKILFVEPVGYLESIFLVSHAKKIVTDSGGLQREAFFAKKQCVTVLDFVVWPETMIDNRNQLARPNREEIIKKMAAQQKIDPTVNPFGDGSAAAKIAELLSR